MSEQLPSLSSDENHVRITIPKNKLKDFIGDVLKTKRQFAKEFNIVFNINKNDVSNIISVIDHRIKEQNSADLSELSIVVLYDDGSSREYTSIDQFESVNDNLKSVSTAVLISTAYLINFSREPFPVKNDIKILLKSSEHNSRNIASTGNVIISVDTNKFTWAEDIINNFSSYIDGRFKKRGVISRFLESAIQNLKYSVLSMLAMIGGLLFLFFSYLEEVSRLNSQSKKSLIGPISGNDISAANLKLDYLMNVSASDYSLWNISIGFKYIIYVTTAILILNILPTSFLRLTGKSYVSIGPVSEEKNRSTIRNRHFLLNTVALGSAFSLLCSILSSYIYDLLKTAL